MGFEVQFQDILPVLIGSFLELSPPVTSSVCDEDIYASVKVLRPGSQRLPRIRMCHIEGQAMYIGTVHLQSINCRIKTLLPPSANQQAASFFGQPMSYRQTDPPTGTTNNGYFSFNSKIHGAKTTCR